MVRADQTGELDADETDALVSSFRESLSDFFAAQGVPENSSLQSTATQIYWHVLSLQKRRMDRLGVRMRFAAERKKYGKSSLEKRVRFDGKYSITEVGEDICATRVYEKQGVPDLRKTDKELAHYSILHTHRSPDNQIVCPNCGNATTRENLLDGCDYCGTKFTVEDLGARVSSFSLREDYRVAYEKYRDSRRYYGRRAFLAGAIPIFILSIIGMISVADEVTDSLLLTIASTAFAAAFCAAAAGYFSVFLFTSAIFPLIQAKKYLTYYSKKTLEEKKAVQERNDAVAETIRSRDGLFSLEDFFSGVQNKLAAIHYADRREEILVFAPGLRETALQACRDVADMDVKEPELLSYGVEGDMQRIRLKVSLVLIRAGDRRFSLDGETICLTLEKSASCRTQAVCAPSVLRCRGCGASLSLAEGGRCAYCGSELDLRAYDWVITDYQTV